MANRVRIISVSLEGIGDGLDQVSLVARRLVSLAYMSLVRVRDLVVFVILSALRSATSIADASQGRTLPPIGEISLSNIGVGLLPVVPLLGRSG